MIKRRRHQKKRTKRRKIILIVPEIRAKITREIEIRIIQILGPRTNKEGEKTLRKIKAQAHVMCVEKWGILLGSVDIEKVKRKNQIMLKMNLLL